MNIEMNETKLFDVTKVNPGKPMDQLDKIKQTQLKSSLPGYLVEESIPDLEISPVPYRQRVLQAQKVSQAQNAQEEKAAEDLYKIEKPDLSKQKKAVAAVYEKREKIQQMTESVKNLDKPEAKTEFVDAYDALTKDFDTANNSDTAKDSGQLIDKARDFAAQIKEVAVKSTDALSAKGIVLDANGVASIAKTDDRESDASVDKASAKENSIQNKKSNLTETKSLNEMENFLNKTNEDKTKFIPDKYLNYNEEKTHEIMLQNGSIYAGQM